MPAALLRLLALFFAVNDWGRARGRARLCDRASTLTAPVLRFPHPPSHGMRGVILRALRMVSSSLSLVCGAIPFGDAARPRGVEACLRARGRPS